MERITTTKSKRQIEAVADTDAPKQEVGRQRGTTTTLYTVYQTLTGMYGNGWRDYAC